MDSSAPFGKSAVVTRATSVLITLIAAFSVGIILRDVFKNKYWWAGTLFLSITPAWFLHSRTAFETAEFTAFYAGTLCAYLFYRYKSPKYLYLVFFFAALAFYSYSPGQLIVPVTALALLISDWRYHWENKQTAYRGLIFLAILTIPYIRYRIEYPSAAFSHLHTLGSYLVEDIPVVEKIRQYLTEYSIGLSAWYWYIPNDRDLPRHLMKDYGHILIATLPFTIIGLARVLLNLRESANRTILISMLASPVSSALVQSTITRILAIVIPVAILTTIGLEQTLQWLESPLKNVTLLNNKIKLDIKKILAAFILLAIGILLAVSIKQPIDRIAVLALVILLALQISNGFDWLANRTGFINASKRWKAWSISPTILTLTVFTVLSYSNIFMLYDSLKNGPLWYSDYGMGGLQYGAFQIFDVIKQYKQEHPETRIIFSPDWANGTDVVARFFLEDPLPFEIGSVEGHITQKLPLTDQTLFVMIQREYESASSNSKFTDLQVEKIIPYPDGMPGFYFVRLKYVDNIDEIFAAEKALRDIPRESFVTIDGEQVKVKHSYLDAGNEENAQEDAINEVFDNDLLSLAKTFEANPFVIELTFPTPRTINRFSIMIGSTTVAITLTGYAYEGAEPITYVFEGQGTVKVPELTFELPEPLIAQIIRIETLDVYATEPTKNHIWEITFR